MFFRLLKSNYQISNSILKAKFPISDKALKLSDKLLKSSTEEDRQKLGDRLLDELADLARIDIVKLKISSVNQSHRRHKGRIVAKQYGYYKPGTHYIYITNRTAARGQFLAPKTFFDTLLHEWMHHYDFNKLKINSIHSSGFYARLKDLKTKLGYFEI